MADAVESDVWLESALRCAELAAQQIARLKNPWWNPTWRDLVAGDPLPDRGSDLRWGLRRNRSRFAKRDAAACSPEAPFDFGSGSGSGSGSGASTSGGDEGSSSPEKAAAAAKRGWAGDVADVSAAGGGCEKKAVSTSAAKDLKRIGKKKKLCELQKEESTLLEEKHHLKKEVDLRRKAYDVLKAENQMLKSQQLNFQSKRVSCESSSAPSSSRNFILPDLNEPFSENFD